MGKTNSFKVQDRTWLYNQTSNSGYATPYLYARVDLPIGDKKVHTRSTRTTDRREAVKRAQEFYLELLLYQRGLGPAPAGHLRQPERQKREECFGHLADAYTDWLEQNAGQDQRKLWSVRNTKQVLYAANGLAKYFGKYHIKDITTEEMRGYSRFQVKHSRRGKLAPGTQKKALITLGLVLKYGVEKGYLDKVPPLPKMKEVDSPRAHFNQQEYDALLAKALELAEAAERRGEKAETDLWYEIADFIVFMVNAFLRSSEWAALRNQHIEVLTGDTRSLKIAVANGKTKPRYTVSMPKAAEVYERILKRNGGKPDAFLFLNAQQNRETARDKMRDRFEILLRETNLKTNRLGQARVIHSLRHTALMFRVLEKVDTFLLAKNAGTSVDQLERFYCSHFSAEMSMSELHKGVQPDISFQRLAKVLAVQSSNRGGAPNSPANHPERKM